MPRSLYRFVWAVSGWHQAGLAALSVMLFAIGIVPLELNRRIINSAAEQQSFDLILKLVAAYLSCSVLEGLTKLCLNIYKNWVGERAVLSLRERVFLNQAEGYPDSELEGIQIAIVVAEAEPVGGFVGDALSQPILQSGILIAVTSYLIYLQPLVAIIVIAIFFPQAAFIPLMQAAINRRVEQKISMTRQISNGIVQAGGPLDADGAQACRMTRIFRTNMSIFKIKFSMNFMMNLLTQMGFAGILGIGSYYVIRGQTELGTVTAFVAGLSKINDPWGDLIDWYRALRVTQLKYGLLQRVMSPT